MIPKFQLRLLVVALIVLIMATALTVDYFLSFSLATGLLYAMAVVVAYFLHNRRALLVTVAVCTVLVLVGYVLVVEVGGGSQSLVNRSMEILTIWMAFWLSLRAEAANEELEFRIEERTKELNFIKEELADAVSNAKLGHWRYDEAARHYSLVSEEYAQIFGYSSEEFQKQFDSQGSCISLVHPEDRDWVSAAYEADDRTEIEFRVLGAKGAERWVHEIRMLSRDEQGALIESWGTMQDITEIKEAQIASEEANKAKSRFMAIMNHELRTPLNGVIGMIELLKQSDMSDEQQQMLKTINESGESLLMIINDILDFSKIESGKLSLELIPMSLLEIVEGAVQALSESATARGVRLISYVDPELPQNVMGDPVRMRQIIINLASNAIKFSEEGTVLTQLELLSRDTGDTIRVRLSVRDEGIGISEEAQGNLFEAFTQAEESTTRKFGGTGLGLVICRMLSELMGGTIGVNSKLGEGSEFYLELPFAIGADAEAIPEDIELEDLRALLVSSEEIERKTFRSYLEHCRMIVDTAEHYQGTLEHCVKAIEDGNPFDLVIFGPHWSREEILPIATTAQANQMDIKFIFILEKTRKQKRVGKEKIGIFLEANSMRRCDLIAGVAAALGLESTQAECSTGASVKPVVAAPSIEEARSQGTLILVAEDNVINRDILGRQLKLLGYAFEMVEDGDLALEAWSRNDYGLLLTDCNMPNMSGIDLTRAIRQQEEGSSKHGKIIAVTANAMEGEAERCLASGMDDFLSKPIRLDDLKEILTKWLPRGQPGDGVAPETMAGEKSVQASEIEESTLPIDDTLLKSNFGDDPEIVKQILLSFVQPADDIFEEINSAYTNHSSEAIWQTAHKLKGAAFSVGANDLGEICKKLEVAGRNDEWEEIESYRGILDASMDRVRSYISGL